jgi:polysaccharide pyruvyl transferase WcaK-like protein
LVSDPAFLLEPKKPKEELKLFAPLSESIGINIGPNLASLAGCSTRDEWVEKVANALLYLHKKFNCPIVLVPHVVNQVNEQRNCDYTFYCKVNKILDANGIQIPIIPPTLNADELKWVIGKLFAFVGSRTHSTIAAFSSCVPCGCIGYSAKSAALCDTFYCNTELHMSAVNFSSKKLFSLVSRLAEERSNLTNRIQYKLPEIIKLAHDSVKYLKEVI